jgi:hypothetical protein
MNIKLLSVFSKAVTHTYSDGHNFAHQNVVSHRVSTSGVFNSVQWLMLQSG